MFTGIVETTAKVRAIEKNGGNISFWMESPLSADLKVDQSLSHNGVCLTVEEIRGSAYKVTAIQETLDKTNLGHLEVGNEVNLERCMEMGGRLDGHIVQGHVDTVGECISAEEKEGSWEYLFSFDAKFAPLIIEKGSVSLNGISLTIFNVTRSTFTVAIIPYTFHHTTMREVQRGTLVNLEFDVIGKYVYRRAELSNNTYL
jgi:riboflavin synthase